MRALADPTRLSLFERLCTREHSVTELTNHYDMSQPAISQHLRVLKRCGLVAERHKGRFALYHGKPEGLRPLVDWLGHYRKFWPTKLDALNAMLKEIRDEGK